MRQIQHNEPMPTKTEEICWNEKIKATQLKQTIQLEEIN